MRLRRKAAVAADAAIASLSSESGDADSTPDPPFQPKSKRAKFDLSGAVAISDNAVIIQQPATIDSLPYEIRRQILSYFDDDQYTVLNLMLVSKVWYVTLRHRKQAELDFRNRCNRMGAKRKSAGCRTWHATWIDLLHKKCVRCYTPTGFNIGSYLLYGFKFLMSYEICRLRSGPMTFVELYRSINREVSELMRASHESVSAPTYDGESTLEERDASTSGPPRGALGHEATVKQVKIRLERVESRLEAVIGAWTADMKERCM